LGKLARQLIDPKMKQLEKDLKAIGNQMVQDLKELVSTPGTRRHHSKPGEPPSYRTDRKRGRHYRSGFKSKVSVSGTKIRFEIDNTTDGGKRKVWLEENLNRPHFETIANKHVDSINLAFARSVRS
jgi:hypothetical protein